MKKICITIGLAVVLPVLSGAEWQTWSQEGRFNALPLPAGATSFNSVEEAGFARTPLRIPHGKRLKSIRFKARKTPNCDKTNQEVMLEERSGEIFYRNITLDNEWRDFIIDIETMSLYPYGSAKVENGRLDQSEVVSLRFNCFPRGGVCQVGGMEYDWEDDPDSDPIFLRKVLLPGNPAEWFRWSPNGRLTCLAAEGEPDALEFDGRAEGGYASLTLAHPEGKLLDAVTFEIKRLPDATANHLEVMLGEADGELFYRQIALTDQYQRIRLTAGDLSFYSYGNAPKHNATLDLAKVKYFRLNCYPQGQNFVVRNLNFEYITSPRTADHTAPESAFVFREIELPKEFERHTNYPDLRKIGIKDNHFVRNGNPYFMLGGWQLDQEGPPWIMRTFDVDVMIYNADEIYTLYGATRRDDGKLEVEWLPNPWYPAIIERFLSNGINFWHEHKGHPDFNALRDIPEFKEVYHAGHFVSYDPFQPLGEKSYLEFYKSWMRYTRQYPIFTYELFNEMVYNNPHKPSREAFRGAMKEKFHGDIKAANLAWGTDFADFDAVRIPGYLMDDGDNQALPRELLLYREGLKYPNLYIDWQKFQEERCYEAIKNLMPKMREFDPSPEPFRTIQSHMQFLIDYADIGIKPEALVDFSDFYSHECGSLLLDCGNRRNSEALFTMLKTMLNADLVKAICPQKPIFDAEAPVYINTVGASEVILAETDLADLSGHWQFFDGTAEEPENWQSPELDDSQWQKIRVPAMWGKEGHPACRLGLYRKHFPRPQTDEPVYLNGQGFADVSEIWLNGKLVGTVDTFDRKFTFDITPFLEKENTLAVKISNQYFSNGMYFGGIRGFASINTDVLVPPEQKPIADRHLRSAFWNMAVHGLGGLMFSYEANFFTPAAKALPRIKAEINTVAPLLYDSAAAPATPLALVYPQETFRGLIHSDYLEKMKAPATSSLLSWYAPLQFSHRGLRVIRNQDLAADRLDGVKFIALPENSRIPAGALENLKKFVADGGAVLVDFNALTIDDDTHQPLDNASFLGFTKTEDSRQPAAVSDPRWGAFEVLPRFLDGFSRSEVMPAPATRVIATYTDGKPLLLEHPFGKGKVWSITGALPADAMQKVIAFLITQTGLAPVVELKPLAGDTVPYAVDAKLFNAGRKRQFLYLLNWEVGGNARVAIPDMPNGEYTVRNLAMPEKVYTLRGEELRNGIALRLEKFDPVTLLIEEVGSPQLPVRGISPTRLAILNELWKAVPEVKGQPNIAISGAFGSTVAENTGTIPTAWKALADNGFNVRNFQNKKTSLDDIDVLVWLQQWQPIAEPDKILDYVRNGGSLLLCGNGVLSYHSSGSNEQFLAQLQLPLGDVRRTVLYDNTPGSADVLRNICTDFNTTHPIAAGVKEFVTAGSGFLDQAPPDAEIVLTAPASSSASGKPLLVTLSYGKGKIVWISDHWFLRPFNLEQGDNLQLWYNIISYLAGKPNRQLTAEEREHALFLTRERLQQAEAEEAAGNFSFAPLDASPTMLSVKSAADLIGIAGGDPIVDQFK